MKRVLNILFSLLLVAGNLLAEEVSFRAQAPGQVIVGRPFQMSYVVNQRGKDLRAPEFEGFDYLAGPYTSQSSSTSFVNGKRTSTFTLTYTYTLMPQKTGTFTLPPATITVGNQQYKSNGLKITVLPEDETDSGSDPTAQRSNSGEQRSNANNQSSASADGSNIFIRTIATPTTVNEQQAISLCYKLYFTGVDVAQFTNNTKLPDFTGFLKMDLDQGDIQTELEHYNGRNYQTAVIYKTLLYPQRSGELNIHPATFEAVLRVQKRARSRSIFDDFFDTYTNVTRSITAPAVTIHVKPLPSGKPADFNGGVGRFTMDANITGTELKTNDAVTVKLTIHGAGNMKLLSTPEIKWPEGFEQYDPKVTNNFKTTAAGMSGTKTIEYLAIARNAGTYTIPALHFSYYDTESGSYKQLTSPEYTLKIAKGDSDSDNASVVASYKTTNKEDIKAIGTDIRYIHTKELTPPSTSLSAFNFGLTTVLIGFLLPLIIAIILFIVFRKQIRENADLRLVRYKKANKVAQKRLKAAAKLMKENKQEAFYEEIERAALSYLSDRLSIPTAILTRDNIVSQLTAKGVQQANIDTAKQVIDTAAFARYAPSTAGSMDDLYKLTTSLIDKLEEEKL